MTRPSAEHMQRYIETARHRQQQRQLHLKQRRQQALSFAQQAAALLRDEFGVRRVVVFGSALNQTAFHETSDLDLAVWGLSPSLYLKALARLLDQSEVSVDLVDAETAAPYIREAIAQGVEL